MPVDINGHNVDNGNKSNYNYNNNVVIIIKKIMIIINASYGLSITDFSCFP